MRRALAVLLLLALAGCSGARTGGAAEPTATTGVLQGVVVDPAIRPLAGANVTVGLPDGTTRNDTADLDGRWSFLGLEAGTYVVSAALPGFLAAQAQANVTAGVADPPVVRIVLEPDQAVDAVAESYLFDGYLQCSVTAVAVRQACDADEAVRPFCSAAPGTCSDNLTQDRFLAVHAVARPGMDHIQSELQWEPASGLGEALRAVPGARDPASGQVQDFEGVEGPSPLIVPMSGEVANALGIGAGKDYALRAFSSYNPATAPPCLPSPAGCQWGVGAAYQQRFTMVTHVFYGFLPPEGWQFGRDGPPQPPG